MCCFILICGLRCWYNFVSVFEKVRWLLLNRFWCCLCCLESIFSSMVCVLCMFMFRCMLFIWLNDMFCNFWLSIWIWFCLCWMVLWMMFVMLWELIVSFCLWEVNFLVSWLSLIFICLMVFIGLLVWIIFWWICLCRCW